MPQKRSSFSRAFQLLVSFWSPAIIFYFIDTASLPGILGVFFPPWRSTLMFFDPAVSFFLETIFFAGAFTILTELITGERQVSSLEGFCSGVKRFWFVGFIVGALPIVLHFALFTYAGQYTLPLDIIRVASWTFTLFWAAGMVLRRKYQNDSSKSGDIFPSIRLALLGAALLIINVGLLSLRQLTGGDTFFAIPVRLFLAQSFFFTFSVFVFEFVDQHPNLDQRPTSPKTLILIQPVFSGVWSALATLFMYIYPAFFAVLRALTPSDYKIIEYNRVFWRKRYYQGNALVAISCYTPNSAEAYRTAKGFRERGAKVIMGGPHVSIFPQEALQFCDSVVVGAAESVWQNVLRDYENNDLKPIYHGTCSAQEIQKVHHFLKDAPVAIAADFIQTSRGCKFKCHFCANPFLAKYGMIKASLEDILAIVKRVAKERKRLCFADNNIYLYPDYAKELFRALIPLKIRWDAACSIDIAQDDEALDLLKKAGCNQLLIGYEIDAGSSHQGDGGKFVMAKDYVALTKKIRSKGIIVKAHYIFGMPGDTWKGFFRLWWFCAKHMPTFGMVSILTPIPGSAFFNDIVREERIIDLNWRSYSLARLVFDHDRLGHPFLLRRAAGLVIYGFYLTSTWPLRIFCTLSLGFLVLWFWSQSRATITF